MNAIVVLKNAMNVPPQQYVQLVYQALNYQMNFVILKYKKHQAQIYLLAQIVNIMI